VAGDDICALTNSINPWPVPQKVTPIEESAARPPFILLLLQTCDNYLTNLFDRTGAHITLITSGRYEISS
jgi:hypothetical protein